MAPATCHLQAQPAVGGNGLLALGSKYFAVIERHQSGRTILAAITAARRIIDALEHCQHIEGDPVGAPHLDDLTESAPEASRAAWSRGRNSFRQNTIGVMASLTSTGMPRTPLGKAVALKPSLVGRAPVPPLLNCSISKLGTSPTSPLSPDTDGPPRSCTFQSEADPSAGQPASMTWCRQPRTVSGNRWPMMWRAATAYGRCTFKMQPSGAEKVIGSSEP